MSACGTPPAIVVCHTVTVPHAVRGVEIDVAVKMEEHGKGPVDQVEPGMRHRHAPAESRASQNFPFAQGVEHLIGRNAIGRRESLRQFTQDRRLVRARRTMNGFG